MEEEDALQEISIHRITREALNDNCAIKCDLVSVIATGAERNWWNGKIMSLVVQRFWRYIR